MARPTDFRPSRSGWGVLWGLGMVSGFGPGFTFGAFQEEEPTMSEEPEITLSIGGTGGVYFLASPGLLIIDLEKRDRHIHNRRTDLRAILFGASADDQFEARLGGAALPSLARDTAWKDPQIFSPRPQPSSGGSGRYRVNPSQKLLRLDFEVDPRACRAGENRVDIRLVNPATTSRAVVLEKLEVHVDYL